MNALIVLSLFVVTADPAKPDEKKILEALQGEWIVEKAETDGKEEKVLIGMTMAIEKTTNTTVINKQKSVLTFKMDVTKKPMEWDSFKSEEQMGKSIFELDGDTLRMCGGGAKVKSKVDKDGKVVIVERILDARPTKFDSKQGSLITLKRVKK